MWGGWDERGAMGAALTVALVADRSAPLGWALLAFMVEHEDDCFVCGCFVCLFVDHRQNGCISYCQVDSVYQWKDGE